jgi:hypothetical protein
MTDKRAPDDKIPIARRNFLLGAGTAVATGLAPTAPAEAQNPQGAPAASPAAEPEPLLTLTATEHAFFVAAADTIIPADELSPSGSECGVATFIDRQLAGAYGSGARLYRDGPFPRASRSSAISSRSRRANSFAPALPPPTTGRAKPTANTSTDSPRRSAGAAASRFAAPHPKSCP